MRGRGPAAEENPCLSFGDTNQGIHGSLKSAAARAFGSAHQLVCWGNYLENISDMLMLPDLEANCSCELVPVHEFGMRVPSPCISRKKTEIREVFTLVILHRSSK